MTIYFDRQTPFYFTENATFDGVEVKVSNKKLVKKVLQIKDLLAATDLAIQNAASPERANQEIATEFLAGFEEIINGK